MSRLGLVLSGGGIRGVAHIGMLQALDEHRLLDDIQMVGGTSAGAIIGAMFALGYTPAGMWQAWQQDVWRQLGGRPNPDAVKDWNLRGLWEVVRYRDPGRFRGLLHGDKLLRLLGQYLVPSPQGTGVQPGRRSCPFYCIATDFNSGAETIWSFRRHIPVTRELAAPAEIEPAPGRYAHWEIHEDDDPQIVAFPAMAEAVRCSASVPFVFVPARATVQYQGQPPRTADYTDGAVRDNFSLSAAVRLAGCDRVIGMTLVSPDPYLARPWAGLGDLAFRTLDQMGRALFEADQDDGVLRETDIRTLIPYLAASIGTFDVSQMPQIYQAGLDVTREFLTRVQQTAGTVTWDSIFATRQFVPLAGAGTLRGARPRTQPAGGTPVAPWPDVAEAPVRYLIYEQNPPATM